MAQDAEGPDPGAAGPANLAGRASPAARRPRRWRRVLGAILLVVGALVAFAPQLIAWSPLRHELPRLRLPGFKEKIRVGAASLSWWGPNELHDIELYAPDGKPFIRIKRASEARGVWRVIVNRTERIQTHVEHPVVEALLRPEGSNLEDALAPVLANRKWPRRERTIEVTDGRLQALDTSTGRSAEWKNLSLKTTTSPDGRSPNRVELSAELAAGDKAAPLRLAFSWTGNFDTASPAVANWDLALETDDLPLAAFAPLLSRVAPDLDLAGTISSRVRLAAGQNDTGSARLPSRGEWQVTTRDLKVAWPSRLGDDQPVLGQIELRGKFSREGRMFRTEDLTVVSELGRLSGGGDIPLAAASGETPNADDGEPAARKFHAEGQLDLVALARLVPHLLPMREDAQLTEGTVELEVNSRPDDAGWAWSGRMETTRLAGRIGAGEISWEDPLQIGVEAHQAGGHFQLERLTAESEFAHASARRTGDTTKFEADCDLDRLFARLSQFLDGTSRELRGKLSLSGEVSRTAPRQFEIAARADAENVLLRRQVTKLVERRAGDVQPIEPEPVEPPPDPVPPGFAPDRRARQALRRAERAAKAETRRREKNARKRADEIVRVPIAEWETVWDEPQLTIEARCRYSAENQSLEIARLATSSDGLRLEAKGRIAEVFTRALVDLEGQADYDLERLVERFRGTVGPHVQIAGRETRPFRLHGPLRDSGEAPRVRPIVPLGLAGRTEIGWQRGDLFGLEAPAGQMPLALERGVIDAGPLNLSISGGRVRLAPRVLLDSRPGAIVIPAGRIAENIELTDTICDAWLKFIAAAVADATRVSGRFSLDLDETRIALPGLSADNVSGRLEIPRGQVLPGPLMIEIGDAIAGLISSVNGNPPRDLVKLERPLLEIVDQRVDFQLRDRRVHHSALEFTVRGMIVRTRGSVGLDQTLDLVAEFTPSEALVSRAKVLEALEGRAFEIPITGTLKHPKVDSRAIGRLAAQFGQTAIESLINRGVRKLMNRDNPNSPK